MRMRCTLICGLQLIIQVYPTFAGAQARADSLPFHRGQWGVEFPIESSVGAGFMRFTSHENAIFLHPRVEFRGTEVITPGFSTRSEESMLISLAVGPRAYSHLAERVIGFFTFGVEPSWALSRFTQRYHDNVGNYLSSWRTLGFGVFGEVGGDYMVTAHLSVGARIGFKASRYRLFPKGTTTSVTTGSDVELSGSRITGALYF